MTLNQVSASPWDHDDASGPSDWIPGSSHWGRTFSRTEDVSGQHHLDFDTCDDTTFTSSHSGGATSVTWNFSGSWDVPGDHDRSWKFLVGSVPNSIHWRQRVERLDVAAEIGIHDEDHQAMRPSGDTSPVEFAGVDVSRETPSGGRCRSPSPDGPKRSPTTSGGRSPWIWGGITTGLAHPCRDPRAAASVAFLGLARRVTVVLPRADRRLEGEEVRRSSRRIRGGRPWLQRRRPTVIRRGSGWSRRSWRRLGRWSPDRRSRG